MRIIVLILALLGTGATGFLGYKWYSDLTTPEAKKELERAKASDTTEDKEKVAKVEKLTLASYALMGAAVLGLIGGLLVLTGKGAIAGLLMLIAGGAPAGYMFATKFETTDFILKSFIFTGPLLLAGLLAFLVPKNNPAPAA